MIGEGLRGEEENSPLKSHELVSETLIRALWIEIEFASVRIIVELMKFL